MHPIAFGDVVVGLFPFPGDFEERVYVEASTFDLDSRVADGAADRRGGGVGMGMDL